MELLLNRSGGGLPQCAVEEDIIIALMRKQGSEDARSIISLLERKGYLRTEDLRIVRLLNVNGKSVWEGGDVEDATFLFVTAAGAAWGREHPGRPYL